MGLIARRRFLFVGDADEIVFPMRRRTLMMWLSDTFRPALRPHGACPRVAAPAARLGAIILFSLATSDKGGARRSRVNTMRSG
jgi:hypothetical protein